MKLSQLVLAAALAAVWAALPPASRANEGDNDGEHERHDERGGGMREHRGPHDADPEMKERFEKVHELERKVREISRNLRQGSDVEKAAAKIEARKALGALFAAKLAMETAMLEKMEKHVVELKAKIARKKSSREKAIESRLARMSGEGDDWE